MFMIFYDAGVCKMGLLLFQNIWYFNICVFYVCYSFKKTYALCVRIRINVSRKRIIIKYILLKSLCAAQKIFFFLWNGLVYCVWILLLYEMRKKKKKQCVMYVYVK